MIRYLKGFLFVVLVGTSACANEEMKTSTILPASQNGDWYSQGLSTESKQVLQDFDSFVAGLLKHMQELKGNDVLVEYRRQKANEFFMDHSAEPEEVAQVKDITVKSGYDDAAIPVRVYGVAEKPSKNLLMYVHGGGWTQGNRDTHDYLCRKLAKIINTDVISVDYRLAPENPYPIPLNDVTSVYKHYAQTNYENIVIAGDSAGGNLCAALCLRISDEKLKRPYAQVLLYPPLGNNFNSKSYETFCQSKALSKAGTMGFFKNYAGGECTDEKVLSNRFIYPLLENDMKKFPRTMIISAGYDVLLDDQLKFAEKMRKQGRPVQHVVDEGAVHGFMTFGRPFDRLVTENCQKIKAFLGM